LVDNESVEKICSQIREDGNSEVESILNKARQTESEIVGKAERTGEEIAEKVFKEAEEKGKTEQKRLLSSVNVEVRRVKLKAREEVVSSIYERVEKSLEEYRRREDYASILAGLVAEAVRALDGSVLHVYADRRDLALLPSKVFPAVLEMMKDEGREIERLEAKKLDGAVMGGVRVGVPGGKVIYDNTFEARMYRLREEMRSVIFEEVFPRK